ncbi:hypothetical protein [Novosphingobium sp. Rr 2-17]|nr:hypothetical protein [Novosphingobium sp. Rr 2-17]
MRIRHVREPPSAKRGGGGAAERYFYTWRYAGLLDAMNAVLVSSTANQ